MSALNRISHLATLLARSEPDRAGLLEAQNFASQSRRTKRRSGLEAHRKFSHSLQANRMRKLSAQQRLRFHMNRKDSSPRGVVETRVKANERRMREATRDALASIRVRIRSSRTCSKSKLKAACRRWAIRRRRVTGRQTSDPAILPCGGKSDRLSVATPSPPRVVNNQLTTTPQGTQGRSMVNGPLNALLAALGSSTR